MQSITPCLWFDDRIEEAVEFYTSTLPGGKVNAVKRLPDGKVLTMDFELAGQPVMALNGGPQFTFTEAISFMITCKDQEEVDYYWDKLTDGGEPGACGWLKDKYGVSWQVTPAILLDYLRDDDPVKANRVMQTMMTMGKIEIAPLQAAYNQA